MFCRFFLILGRDAGERSTNRYSFTCRNQQFAECASGRRGHFRRHLVGLDFHYRLTCLNNVISSLKPTGDRPLDESISEFGHENIGGHNIPLNISYSAPATISELPPCDWQQIIVTRLAQMRSSIVGYCSKNTLMWFKNRPAVAPSRTP